MRAAVSGFLDGDGEDGMADEFCPAGIGEPVRDGGGRSGRDAQPQRRRGGLGPAALAQQQQGRAGVARADVQAARTLQP